MRLILFLILSGLVAFANAQSSFTWNGGGSDDNMSTSANWGGSTPGGAEYLNFAGSTRLTPNNDLSSTNRFQLWFNSGASSFTLGGSTNNTFYDFGGTRPKIENSSTNNQTVNFPVTGGYSGGLEINPVSGDLTFGGAIANGGNHIWVYGNNGHDLFINGGLTGSGALEVEQNSTVYIQSACSYSGDTYLDGNGDMVIGTGGSLGSTNVRISSGSTFTVNNSVTVPSISERGTSNGGTISIASGQVLTVNGANQGTFYQNSISGDGGLTISGSGTTTMSLYGSQTFTGAVTITGGTLSSGVSMSSTSFTVSGGELDLTAADIISNSANIELSSGGTLDFQEDETINNLTANGGTINIAAGKTLTINGTLSIEASTTINLNSTGSIAFGSGATIEYNTGGSITTTDAEWPSSNGPDNVTISGGTSVTLHDARSVSGTFTLTSGTISLGSNNLTIGSSGGFSGTPSWGSSTTSYIIAEGSGRLVRTVTTSATLFPIGTSSAYMPIRLAQGSGSGSYSINLASPTGLDDASYALDRVWDITGSGTVDMDMQWPDGAEGANFPTTGVTCIRYSGSSWSDLSESESRSGSDPYTISFSSITCCSQFGPAGSQALPVDLISFGGNRISDDLIELNWSTASEINNDYFILERSDNGNRFEEIGRVTGSGNSFSRIDYSWLDADAPGDVVWYRLKQVDFDLTTELLSTIKIGGESDRNPMKIYPNPTDGPLELIFETGDAIGGKLIITSVTGAVVYSDEVRFTRNTEKINIDAAEWVSGVYIIQMETEFGIYSTRVVR